MKGSDLKFLLDWQTILTLYNKELGLEDQEAFILLKLLKMNETNLNMKEDLYENFNSSKKKVDNILMKLSEKEFIKVDLKAKTKIDTSKTFEIISKKFEQVRNSELELKPKIEKLLGREVNENEIDIINSWIKKGNENILINLCNQLIKEKKLLINFKELENKFDLELKSKSDLKVNKDILEYNWLN